MIAQDNTDIIKGNMSGDDMKSMMEKRAADLTSDLQSKVNLTDSQVSDVKAGLIDYMTKVSIILTSQRAGLKEMSPMDTSYTMDNSSDKNYTEELKNADADANKTIESVITDDQKTKWSSVKDSWWTEVKAVVYNNSMSK
jgi:hypothetical protein